MTPADFHQLLYRHADRHFRTMPWRRDTRGYYVIVSELMLQQTQVERVIPKFEQFITRFPDFETLAAAPLAEVLTLWSGLGYNRRAKYLHEAAKAVISKYDGTLPAAYDELLSLPGVGVNTAGALLAYVYNQPVIFVETNVRTVFFHHFFADQTNVSDTAVRAELTRMLDRDNPRQFYWALMDYGAWLKRGGVKNVAASQHYRKQSPLAGSVREIRGRIIKQLARDGWLSVMELQAAVDPGDGRFESAYRQLLKDGLIGEQRGRVGLTH